MASLPQLNSVSNPRVKAVVRLRERQERDATGLFAIEALRETQRALAARLVLRALYLCPPLLGDAAQRSLEQALGPWQSAVAAAEVFEVSANVLRKMTYRENPEGIVAVFEQRAWMLADLASQREAALLLIAVGTTKPGNLGAMARSAAAAGAAGVIVAGPSVDTYNPNAIRSSTGAIFTLPTVAADEQEVLDWLQAQGIALFAAAPQTQGAVNYDQVDLTRPAALAIGAEDTGLSSAWLSAAASTGGAIITIPMAERRAGVDSLNASAAAAVLLFEAARQRRGGG